MGEYLEEILSSLVVRQWKPLKRPEAVCLGCSGKFVGHCKLQVRS